MITVELFQHQSEAIDFIEKNNGIGALFHSIGLGKTRTALEIFSRYKQQKPELKMVVICPISLIHGAWGEDIQTFTGFKYRDCHDKGMDVRSDTDIFIVNFEWLRADKNKSALMNLLNAYPCMAVIDESSKIKNFKAITTKAILSLRNCFKYKIILSGTPAPNSEMEYWPQMQFLGDIFPKSFYQFRNMFFHLERNGQVIHGQVISKAAARDIFSKGWKYGITSANKQLLISTMKPYCHFRDKEDCLDLPEQVDEIRYVEMDELQRKIYNTMKRECIAQINCGNVVAQVALTKIMKLRQIASGFAIDENGNNQVIGVSAKTTELMDILEELGNRQVIIWAQFHYEIGQLLKLLPGAVSLYGKTPDAERNDNIVAFKTGRAKYLIAHPRSAGHGLTFTNCSVQVFYSLDYSWELYEQARGRTHRAGQKDTCVYIHLLAANTIDEVILAVLRRKGDAQEIIEQWMKRT